MFVGIKDGTYGEYTVFENSTANTVLAHLLGLSEKRILSICLSNVS